MLKRRSILGLVLSGCFLVGTQAAEAQREGFIIGIGLGPGTVRQSVANFSVSDWGLAGDFHIGGVISDVEVYYAVHLVSVPDGDTSIGRGVAGLGVAKMVKPRITVNGALGWAAYGISANGTTETELNGIAFDVGGRYDLNESGRWAAALNIWHARPEGTMTWTGASLTINIMSH